MNEGAALLKLPYTIENIHTAIKNRAILWREHASEKMLERGIRKREVKECIINGEIIEEYYNDYPFPSCLVFGRTSGGRPIHVVCSLNEDVLYIKTSYEPNVFKWQDDYKTRREQK